MSALLDKFISFSDRHKRALSIFGAISLAVSVASYVGLIELPKIPFLTDKALVFVSTAYNALWWGFLNPRIARRRVALAALTTAGAQNG